MTALIAAQAGGHADPQADHGRDDQHGHKPEPQPGPPVVEPPVAQPPVAQPPAPRPASDAAAPARAIAMMDRVLADGRMAEAGREAFATAAAVRRAAVTVAQGQAALAIFANIRAEMDGFRTRQPGSRV
jgi:hypothetical protein